MTVVKAESAASYMHQPKISRRAIRVIDGDDEGGKLNKLPARPSPSDQADCGSVLPKSEANASRALGAPSRFCCNHSLVTSMVVFGGATFPLLLRPFFPCCNSSPTGEPFLINFAFFISLFLTFVAVPLRPPTRPTTRVIGGRFLPSLSLPGPGRFLLEGGTAVSLRFTLLDRDKGSSSKGEIQVRSIVAQAVFYP